VHRLLYYRFEPRPVAVARGNEKGRVERAIRYIRDGFFEARRFTGVDDLNAQLAAWLDTDALDRPWVEDRTRTVRSVFDEERALLLPLPDAPFPCDERVEVEVGKTPYARFDLNDYSVPHDRAHRTLVAFATMDTVRFVDGNDEVAQHARSWDRGQQIENPDHLQRLTEEKVRARTHRGQDRLSKSAPSTRKFLTTLASRGGNVGSTIARLLKLLDEVGAVEMESAVAEAIACDTVHAGAVRQIIDRRRAAAGLPPPVGVPITSGKHAALVVTPHALATYDKLKTEGEAQ
jgi:hypothetical protein